MRFVSNSELGRVTPEQFGNIGKMPVTVVLDNVRSGLNTGSVFRSCDSFLVEHIILCGITARPPEREVLKTALGATETVPWRYYQETSDALKQLRDDGFELLAIEQSDKSISLERVLPVQDKKYALIFGHEVNGVDQRLIPMLDGCIEIPQSGTKHSLNVSVCAGIVLWKFYEKLILQK
jgi:23S rRNA (guanosine2251-2'-O)-methyltransferase